MPWNETGQFCPNPGCNHRGAVHFSSGLFQGSLQAFFQVLCQRQDTVAAYLSLPKHSCFDVKAADIQSYTIHFLSILKHFKKLA